MRSSPPPTSCCSTSSCPVDGYELLEELKGLPERSWKVVALTAHALPEDRTRASAAGFDGYITKPIDVRTFPAEVARYLGG